MTVTVPTLPSPVKPVNVRGPWKRPYGWSRTPREDPYRKPVSVAYSFLIMVNSILGWVARRRVAVLSAATLTSVVAGVLVLVPAIGRDLTGAFVARTLLPLAFIMLSAYAAHVHHPARLIARPGVPAFDVPAGPGAVLTAAGLTVYACPALAYLATDGDSPWLLACVAVTVAGLLATHWTAALGRSGVRLTPDGIEDRGRFGSLVVPWDALDVPRAAFPADAQQVNLYLARPQLVRKRGLRVRGPGGLPATGINAEFLARTIHEYANRPDLRPTVGSEAALARLRAIPQIAALTDPA